jgi:prepilin peptidase CpaA
MLYFLIVAALVAAVGALVDFRTGHIPNWLTLGTLPIAVLAHGVVGWRVAGGVDGALHGLGYSLAGAAVCSAIPLFMYFRGAIGGGDVKLFAAMGALCQPMAGLEEQTYAFVIAAILAPAKLAYDGVLLQTLRRSLALVINPFRKRERRTEIPAEMMTWFRLGPAIFLGAAATVLMHWDWP